MKAKMRIKIKKWDEIKKHLVNGRGKTKYFNLFMHRFLGRESSVYQKEDADHDGSVFAFGFFWEKEWYEVLKRVEISEEKLIKEILREEPSKETSKDSEEFLESDLITIEMLDAALEYFLLSE